MTSKKLLAARDSKSEKQSTAKRNNLEREEQTPLAELVQRAKLDPSFLSSKDILQLQRTIGNQAVMRLLKKETDVSIQPSPPSEEEVSENDQETHTEGQGGLGTSVEQGPKWSARGKFKWRVAFHVDNGETGAIVQKIENTFVGSKPGWRPVQKYWEAWNVDEGEVEKGGKDDWIRPEQLKFSRGNWSMKGTVYFVNQRFPDGFEEGGVKDAAGLLSRLDDPDPEDLGDVKMIRTANGSWGPLKGHKGQVG